MTRLRILYAEDQAFYAQALSFALEDDGHAVEVAADGQAALERVRKEPTAFDVVITDHQMPQMDGLGLVSGLRALNFPGRIIVYSSRVGEEQIAGYQALKVDRIAMKGPDPTAILSLLAGLS